MSEERKKIELDIQLLETAREKYREAVNNMGEFFSMTKKDRKEIKAKAEATIAGYTRDIDALKAQLKKLVAELSVNDLKKELLETGKLDQQKIEEKVQELGIESIELSPEAQEMKIHQKKVSSIFDKYLNKGTNNGEENKS